MPNRLTAALGAVLAFAATLAVVADTAAAHEQTTTKRYCSYDPFAGKQCWTETVPVAHRHPPPNQTCPAGTTGTPPNCLPVPSDNSGTRTQPPTTTTTAPPKKCPPGQTGTPPNCKTPPPKTCPAGQTGTPPNCQAEKEESGRSSGTKGTRSNRDTTTTKKTDPCGDYNESLVDALSKAAHSGTYNPPAKPDGCKGPSTLELLAKLESLAEAQARNLAKALKALQDAPDSASEEATKAAVALGGEIEKLWDKTPDEAKVLIQTMAAYGGCAALTAAVAKSTTATASTAALAWRAWLASPAGKKAVDATCTAAVTLSVELIKNHVINNNDKNDDNGQGDTDGKSGTKGTRSNRPQPETSTTTPPPTTTTPPKVTKDQVDKAREKWWNGEMDYYDFIDLNNRYKCDSGQIKCSG